MCEIVGGAGDTASNAFVGSTTVLMSESLRQMTLPSRALRFRPSFLLRKVHRARATVDSFLEDCITTRKREEGSMQTSGSDISDTTDLLQILLQAERDGDISREEVKAQLFTFLFAGHDTTAHTLSYLCWEVSQNSTLQEILSEEVRMAIPERNDTLRVAVDGKSLMSASLLAQAKLPWLDRTFSETLRKHPIAATGTSRYNDRSSIVVGDGLELPSGVSIQIPPWSLHRNTKYWPDPERFDPSRFEVPLKDMYPYSFQAFSGGPRNCIGSQLARAEALHIMAPLLRRYEVICDETQEPDDFVTLTRRPRQGIRFRFRCRGS